ncbi:hypothetical protein ABES35_06270 [Bacillus subtilis]|uniref:hypothetical protein n=1 Tax=Bacillus subtilis TaxID=1423 RepID=UPI002DBF74DD|nr:hypothetical protein [Bacillus subtilis]MEC2400506.1 hypothetical protein [Bacillus subtilis]
MAKRVSCLLPLGIQDLQEGAADAPGTRCQDKVADMAKRVSCPLPLVSRIFRKAQPVRQGGMAGIGRQWP